MSPELSAGGPPGKPAVVRKVGEGSRRQPRQHLHLWPRPHPHGRAEADAVTNSNKDGPAGAPLITMALWGRTAHRPGHPGGLLTPLLNSLF